MNNPTTSWNDTQKLLAFVIVVALVAVIFVWMFFPPKGDAAAMAALQILTGALVASSGQVISFYFGNSRSSVAKDQTIATLSATPPTTGGPTVTAQTTASG